MRFVCNLLTSFIFTFVLAAFVFVTYVLEEVCRWQSELISYTREVVDKICKQKWLSWICSVITTIIDVVETVTKWICENVIKAIIDIIHILIGLIRIVNTWICTILTFASGYFEYLMCTLNIGIKKSVTVQIIIIRDKSEIPTIKYKSVEAAMNFTKEVFNKCDIKVNFMPVSYETDPTIFNLTDCNPLSMVSTIWYTDLNFYHVNYNPGMGFNGITIFLVDSIIGTSPSCRFLNDPFVRIDSNINSNPSLIAHEIGHILGLNHSNNSVNLMYSNPTVVSVNLTESDCCVLKRSQYAVPY